MKMKETFNIHPPSPRLRRTSYSTPKAQRRSQQGIALVITLIMLSVTLVMAVAFLALAKRERGSVSTATDTSIAQLAAKSGLQSAQAQIVANILNGFSGLDSTNAYNLHLLVSTNYINQTWGFQPNIANPTNVNYYDNNGNLLTGNSLMLNISNLYYLPRAPVFVPTGQGYDFRYYLDLNENGSYDKYGFVPQIGSKGGYIHPDGTEDNTPVNVVSNLAPGGDPEWIGVLEHPDAPHGPNNHFISRFAYIAVPAGNTLDFNYIYNDAFNIRNGSCPTITPASDGFMRNQGVGSWELNLAAFLADLNTNEWDASLSGGIYKYQTPPSPIGDNIPNSGAAFADASSLLAYRYGYNYNLLNNAYGSLTNVGFNYPYNIDVYGDGPLLTTLTNNAMMVPDKPNLAWAGGINTNHFFSLGDFFDTSKLGAAATFTNHLRQASTRAGTQFTMQPTYDRYTFYRMLDQIATDSSPEDGKMNLNFSNAVVSYWTNNSSVRSVGIVAGAETNLVPWTPREFFHAAADKLLRLYTAEWFQSDPTNFLTTYYGYVPRGHLDATGLGVTNFPNYGQTNQIPTFGITNIPVLVNGYFVYSPAVNRLLQLAANLYDATTNGNFNLPHAFRPILEHDRVGNMFIVGFANVASVAINHRRTRVFKHHHAAK